MSEEKTHWEGTPTSRERFSIAWRKPPMPQKRSIYLRAFAAARLEPFCIAECFANRGGNFKTNRISFVLFSQCAQRESIAEGNVAWMDVDDVDVHFFERVEDFANDRPAV